MELIKDIVKNGSDLRQVWFNLFNCCIDLDTEVEGNFSFDYAEKCAMYLNSLLDRLIDRLCIASINYCNTFLDDTGQELKRFSARRSA